MPWVLLFLALLELLTLPLHWLFMPNRPAALKEASSTPSEMLRSKTFTTLTAALVAVSGITLNLQAIPILLEKGFEAGFAASIGALVGLMGLPGRLLFTPLGALALLIGGPWSAYAFLVLSGVGFGAIAPNKSALLTEVTLRFDIDCDADQAKLERMIQTTERYCVILQTLKNPPKLSVAIGAD